MKFVIRADASLQIGTGHVMRCLTLAEALKEKGAQVEFICREHERNLIDFIQGKGFKVHRLSVIENDLEISKITGLKSKNILSHAHWLGATQQQDADVCKVILKKIGPDWLIVDHYAIDETWQMELQGTYKKLMVIDDLADRQHLCDLLLDQTFCRRTQGYKELVPDNCQMLLGSQYALLRSEFAQWREYSLKRRENPEFNKLLISMGGVDQDNVTGKVLEELKNGDLPSDLEITVVMGSTAPHLKAVQQQAKILPYKTEVKSNVSNMAEIMSNADFAIGASGATTWERCRLGLPSAIIVLAENQKDIANILAQKNIAIVLDNKSLKIGIKKIKIMSKQDLFNMSTKAAKMVDGLGAQRVINVIYEDIV
ncbi:MAG: UDP-2,4-diacetamido-2,4,6-trideoxy-beta-L-altropyranose hydrolase [Piscirickettsiaceae bacterium]|nr:MAG: UDP-2,4-diacetamido-2,4,6-trideoxy-beta-L-altropyranose hydrolase [Piscirickettsiaceae bacterium]